MDHDLDTERIIQAALLARSNAYCPYSKFRVGAALLSADGQVITGANVENASYGGTICAERTALVKAVSEGVTKFKAIAVARCVDVRLSTIYTNELHFSDVKAPISPCGMCRQFMREFCELDMPVVMVSAGYNSRDFKDSVGDHVKTVTLEELLPYSFGL